MSFQTICIIGAIYLLAMMVQRICGFGMGSVAVMLLPYFTGSFVHAASYTNILTAVSAVYLAYRYRDKVRWKLIIPILCGSFIATWCAVHFLQNASFFLLEKILGVVLLALSAYFLFFKGKLRITPRPRNGFLTGICGGTLNGLFATGGPAVVVYLLGATESHAVYLATIQGYFAVNNIYSVVVRMLNGQITAELLRGLWGAVPGMVLGILLGDRLAPYLPDQLILKAIYILMGISGLLMIF